MEDATQEHLEHAEHAEHAAHQGNPFVTTVSITIAILAVIAATIGSLETIETGSAIAEKNAAMLKQSQASDQWAFYQAKSLKKNMYDIAKEQAAAAGSAKAEDFAKSAKRYETEQDEIKKKAEELEHARDEKLAEGDHHEHRHHILTIGVTIVHVSIAIATIAIITKGKRWPWYMALGLGAIGMLFSGTAYLG
eukprot:gene7358-7426_t